MAPGTRTPNGRKLTNECAGLPRDLSTGIATKTVAEPGAVYLRGQTPELRFLINSLLKAIPRMGYIALLMFIIFYIYAAMGSMFFASVDEELWGDVAIAMLTLFRVATFEDWTDVMYATMEQYPLSWVFYITFIFLTAFVFLNMMIGAILEVMSEEQNAKQAQQAHDERDEIARQLQAVQVQLAELTKQISEKR